MQPPPPVEDRSLGPLFRQLMDSTSTLIRQEIGLLRAELQRSARQALRGAIHLAAGAGLLMVALLLGLALLVIVLGHVYGEQYWFAALLVGLVLAFPGAVTAYYSFQQLRRDPLAPREAIESLRDTSEWARSEGRQLKQALRGEGPAPTDAPR